ncbi:MAG: YfhO family protein, partial [bacterium]|nr:YfhO family protein [bacterium]
MKFLRPCITRFWPLIFLLAVSIFFFRLFVFERQSPIPADTIVGLYHPFRDFYADEYPKGIPFKNFLITDPVRQQYPWRELAIDSIKKGQWPLWNPYSFSGTPLLANLQSSPFYPLNLLFFVLPFNLSWGLLIFLEPLLAGGFLYLYLRNLNLEKWSSILGAISFSFSGFFIAWLEWGTTIHSALWLPLVLLSIDKIYSYFRLSENAKIPPEARGAKGGKAQSAKLQVKTKNLIAWGGVFIFSLISSFFAGHLQTFFYVGVVSVVYVLTRWWQYKRGVRVILLFAICYLLFVILTAVQWAPALQFINLSGRELDQIGWQNEGWFIPWQNFIQFLAPDFFGNPATLNYWGVWNYAEFIGYVGVLPFILALYALIWRQDKKTLFFGSIFFLSLLFAFPTPLAKIPYQLQIPFFSTSQPTRLLFLTDFSLAVLAAMGLDFLLKFVSINRAIRTRGLVKRIGSAVFIVLLILAGLWIFTYGGPSWFKTISAENFAVSKRNIVLPTALFLSSVLLLLALAIKKIPRIVITGGILIFVVFDLLRFGQKFTPFSKEKWIFPNTKTIEFLQMQEKPFRIMVADRRIFPPNFPVAYHLESIEGYDPLYLSRYAELIAASERGKPDISPPFGFNRIITPQNYESKIIDLLNVKYILSLSDLKSDKLRKVFEEGETKIYENLDVLPRAFFVENVEAVKSKEEAVNVMFASDFDPQKTAVVEAQETLPIMSFKCLNCQAKILDYRENKVKIETENEADGFLVLTDGYYPTWHVV